MKIVFPMSKENKIHELITNHIVKKLPPQRLTDFIGEFNYIHSMLDNPDESIYDPSMALIRNLVCEYIIFPLGSELVRARFPENIRSFLFYGPSGTGKTLVVRACAYETNSVIYDLSPTNIDGLYAEKKGEDRMIALVMCSAKEFQPSIIYIDEAERVWPVKKKGKGKKKAKKKSDPGNPTRMKKTLGKYRTKWIDDKTRITIIGCLTEPTECSKAEVKKFFDKNIYFPVPQYTTARLMWKTFIENNGGIIKANFPLSTLAHISKGYSAGAIKKTCEKVLTEYRVSHQEQRPLTLSEFIGPLSLCPNLLDDQQLELEKFTDTITGDLKRREDEKKQNEEGGEAGDAKKAPKKGAKKK